MKHTRLLFVLFCVLLSCCDESLPPRIDPRTLDPADYLEISVQPVSGLVFYQFGDTLPQSAAGNVYLTVKNLHDEVMSGPEAISIDIQYHGLNFPTDTAKAHGDSDNLLNPYNLQGNIFMLENEILTIHPDSVARFLIVWNHTEERFWQYANAMYLGRTCPNPPCDDYIVTSELDLECTATIRLFTNQEILLHTQPVRLTVSYFFDVASSADITLLGHVGAVVNPEGNVVVSWTTRYRTDVYRFLVQKSIQRDGGFHTILGGELSQVGTPTDTVSYSVVDVETQSGGWWYRIGITDYFYPAGVFLVDSTEAVFVDIP